MSVEFALSTDRMLLDLSEVTSLPPDALRRQVAESLVVLRIAGELVLPALRTACADSEEESLEALVVGPITDLVAVASTGSLSSGTLWGNVASVIESSARMIAAEDDELGRRATAIATRTLFLEPFAGGWTGEVGSSFRRTTCCQIVGPDPEELRCGDCVRSGKAA